MFWIVPTLLTTLFSSMRDIYSKHSVKHLDEYIVAMSTSLFTLPFLAPFLFFIEIPAMNTKFFLALIGSSVIWPIAYISFVKALKHSDISVTIPLIAFTPVFMLVTSPLMVGEFPPLLGILGICLGVTGSYMLNIRERKNGYLAPFKALVKDAGPRYMLLAAFLFSINANLDKIGYQNSSVIFWVIAGNAATAFVLSIIVSAKSKNPLQQIRQHKKKLFVLGGLHAGNSFFYVLAISMTLVAYVVSVKRLSILTSVLSGHYFFKEKGVKERFLGAVIMIVGVVLIAFS